MKKLYALLVAGCLTVAMVAPTFAATSPSTNSTSNTATTAVTTSVEGVTIKAPTTEVVAAVTTALTQATVLADLGVASSATISTVIDVNLDNIPAGGVDIEFTLSDVPAGKYVYLVHRMASGQYEVVGQGYLGADKKISGTFKSFSPVAVMVADQGPVSGAKAPKTGEF